MSIQCAVLRGPALIDRLGFLAVAYHSCALLVVDMRGPRVILRNAPPSKKDHRHSILGPRREPVVSLAWTAAPMASGAPSPLLSESEWAKLNSLFA